MKIYKASRRKSGYFEFGFLVARRLGLCDLLFGVCRRLKFDVSGSNLRANSAVNSVNLANSQLL